MDRQDSSGCRGCSKGTDVRVLARPGPRQPGSPKAPGRHGAAGCQCGLGDGPRVPGRRHSPTGAGPGVHARDAAARDSDGPRGSTTGRCTSDATRSSVCSARLKGYRRIFSRFEKLHVMFIGFIHFVPIFDVLELVLTVPDLKSTCCWASCGMSGAPPTADTHNACAAIAAGSPGGGDQHSNPVPGVERAREEPRDRVLAPSELAPCPPRSSSYTSGFRRAWRR